MNARSRVFRNLIAILCALLSAALVSAAAATAEAPAEVSAAAGNKDSAAAPTETQAAKSSASKPSKAALSGDVGDAQDEPPRIQALSEPVIHEVKSIPYPNGAIYVKRGLTGAFLGGKHKNQGEDQSLFQWQGELGYFYTPYISGGLGFRITAGEPSSSAQKIFNRYFLNVRVHRAWENLALYVGPQLGMGNLNILTDSTRDTTKTGDKGLGAGLKNIPSNTKPTLSLDAGMGWKLSRYLAVTFGTNMEYSFVTEEGVGWSNALNLHLNPGLSFDLLAYADSWRDLVPALYVNIEFQSGYLIFEKSGHRLDQAGVLGLSLSL